MTARTVLHGVDQSCPDFASMPTNAPMGFRVYQEDLKNVWIFDETIGEWVPDGVVAFKYDFAEHGGEQGVIEIGTLPGATVSIEIEDVDLTAGVIVVHLDTLRGSGNETIIYGGMYTVEEAIESDGSARIGLRVEGAHDLLDLAAIATAGAVGVHDIIPRFSAATAVRVNGPVVAGSSSEEAEASPSPSSSVPY